MPRIGQLLVAVAIQRIIMAVMIQIDLNCIFRLGDKPALTGSNFSGVGTVVEKFLAGETSVGVDGVSKK